MTFTCYVRPNGTKLQEECGSQLIVMFVNLVTMVFLLGKKVSLFVCCRDGRSKENKNPRKTPKKRFSSGSRKMKGSCLSRMTATEDINTGEVELSFIKTHTNHRPGLVEVKYIPLPGKTKQEVRDKYADGVELDKIIDGNTLLNPLWLAIQWAPNPRQIPRLVRLIELEYQNRTIANSCS